MPKGIWGHRGKPATCHPDKPNVAYGLCANCSAKKYYHKWYTTGAESETTKRRYRLTKYNLSIEEYNQLLYTQQNKCAICESGLPKQGKSPYFCVDHDHTTNKVRGLLCGPCNRGIGYLQDNPEIILKAYQYLIKDLKV